MAISPDWLDNYTMTLFTNTFSGQTVLVTGHTGFKGAWLTQWLCDMGAHVVGFSLPDDPTVPSLYNLAQLGDLITDVRGDVSDLAQVNAAVQQYRPTTIFHLAAQPIVLTGYEQPHATIQANVMGTVNVLEAIRQCDSVRAAVCVTTDKVYANREWVWGYRESDRLGGRDPYSASKAMAELAIASYRASYFAAASSPQIASVRAGNVIGGGDFAPFRLVPDCMNALIDGRPIPVRNPHSIRPWQHVLEPLSGYLLVATRLLAGDVAAASAWNFGPLEQNGITTRQLAEKLIALWGSGSWTHTHPEEAKEETHRLRLTWEKAASELAWQPVYTWADALGEIVDWCRAYTGAGDMRTTTQQHIAKYVTAAQQKQVAWAQ